MDATLYLTRALQYNNHEKPPAPPDWDVWPCYCSGELPDVDYVVAGSDDETAGVGEAGV